jgi:hypothetical protein
MSRHGVLSLLACVVVVRAAGLPVGYAQERGASLDDAASLEVVAETLPGSVFFNHSDQPVPIDVAVRCLQEKGQVARVAAEVTVRTGVGLREVATQLNRRVGDGTYHQHTSWDTFRAALGTFGGPQPSTAYAFQFGDVLDHVGGNTLKTRIDIGSVRPVAAQKDGSYRLVHPVDEDWQAVMLAIEQGHGTSENEYRFVARDDNLAGVESHKRLISWNAESRVLPEGVFLRTRLLEVLARATRAAKCE